MHCQAIRAHQLQKPLNIQKNHAPNALASQLKRARIIASSDIFPICCHMVWAIFYFLVTKFLVLLLWVWTKISPVFTLSPSNINLLDCLYFWFSLRLHSLGSWCTIGLWRRSSRYESRTHRTSSKRKVSFRCDCTDNFCPASFEFDYWMFLRFVAENRFYWSLHIERYQLCAWKAKQHQFNAHESWNLSGSMSTLASSAIWQKKWRSLLLIKTFPLQFSVFKRRWI